jgi:hypothetical protein
LADVELFDGEEELFILYFLELDCLEVQKLCAALYLGAWAFKGNNRRHKLIFSLALNIFDLTQQQPLLTLATYQLFLQVFIGSLQLLILIFDLSDQLISLADFTVHFFNFIAQLLADILEGHF